MLILEVLMYSNKAESSSSENSNSREDISAFSLSVKILGTPARHNQQINAFQKSSFFFFSFPAHLPTNRNNMAAIMVKWGKNI